MLICNNSNCVFEQWILMFIIHTHCEIVLSVFIWFFFCHILNLYSTVYQLIIIIMRLSHYNILVIYEHFFTHISIHLHLQWHLIDGRFLHSLLNLAKCLEINFPWWVVVGAWASHSISGRLAGDWQVRRLVVGQQVWN